MYAYYINAHFSHGCDEIHAPDAFHPVQQQLGAYNARDIDGSMNWWADDCQYYAFPSTLLANGAAEIRALLTRMVVSNVVVDHEAVTRTFPERPSDVDVICIYEVEHGNIARAWFKLGERRRHGVNA